jgi:hypothetical protein
MINANSTRPMRGDAARKVRAPRYFPGFPALSATLRAR